MADSTTGTGGLIEINADGVHDITFSGGRVSANGAAGSNGGEIIFKGENITVSTSSAITLNGGSMDKGKAGSGGKLTFKGPVSGLGTLALSNGTIEVKGGASTGTATAGTPLEGGNGGAIIFQSFGTVSSGRAMDLSGGSSEGGPGGFGGTVDATTEIRKFTSSAGITLDGGKSTFSGGWGGPGGSVNVAVSGSVYAGTITFSGNKTISAVGGIGVAQGGDGGKIKIDATQNATSIFLSGSTMKVSGGTGGGAAAYPGKPGVVEAYTIDSSTPDPVITDPTVEPASAYIRRIQ
jgi:hypothetical protein